MTASADCAACLKSVPQRYIIAFMTFLAIVGLLMMRTCLSMTLTQMVAPTTTSIAAHPMQDEAACPARLTARHSNASVDVETHESHDEKFEWSQHLQGIILSSFYVGYVLLHLPGGILAERIGAKPVIVFGLLISAILSALTPLIVNTGGASALIVLRVLLGCVQAGFFPAVATMLSKWVPTNERGRIGSLVYCGIPFGAIVGNFIAGVLMHVTRSWHSVFYICGAVGAVLALLFTLICTNCPSTHPFISDEEKHFLRKQIGPARCRDEKPLATPWKAILTSSPILALIVAEVFGRWAYFVMMIDLPKYMNDVLHVSIQENGIYSSLPWVAFVLVSFVSGYVSDWVIATNRLGITNTRKLLVIISSAINGSFVLAAAYAGCDPMVVGALFTVAVGIGGLETSSTMINPLDLSPNFSGMICGIIGTIACIMGVAVPVVISLLTPHSLQTEWRLVFWVTFFTHIAKITVFTMWGSGEVQPWNEPEVRKDVATVELIDKNNININKNKIADYKR